MGGHYFDINGEIKFRLAPRWKNYLEGKNPGRFTENITEIDLSQRQRVDLTKKAFDAVDKLSRSNARVILIGAAGESKNGARQVFNAACAEYCAIHPKFHFVDVNAVLPEELKADERHYSPAGYYELSRHILGLCDDTKEDRGQIAEAASANSPPARSN
jgi:hypothetical protein